MMFSIIQRLSELLPKIRNKSSAVNLLEKIKKFRGQDINYLQKVRVEQKGKGSASYASLLLLTSEALAFVLLFFTVDVLSQVLFGVNGSLAD